MLPANVPDLEVHICEVDSADILTDCWDCWLRGYGCGGIEGLYSGEKGRLAGVVKAKEEDGIFYGGDAISEEPYERRDT